MPYGLSMHVQETCSKISYSFSLFFFFKTRSGDFALN